MADERVEKVDEKQEELSSVSSSGEESGENAGDSSTADKTVATGSDNDQEPVENVSAPDESDSDSDTDTSTADSADSGEVDTSEPEEDSKSEVEDSSSNKLMPEEAPKIKDKFQFIVFHPSHFIGTIIRTYLYDLGFQDVEIVSDLHTFTRALITAVNGLTEKQVVFSVFPHVYKVLRFWLQSDDFSALRKSLPTLLDCPILVFVEKASEIKPGSDIVPECVISLDESLESNRKRIIEYLSHNSCSSD